MAQMQHAIYNVADNNLLTNKSFADI